MANENMLFDALPEDCTKPPRKSKAPASYPPLTHKLVSERATRYIFRLHGGLMGAFEFACGWQLKERVDGLVYNSNKKSFLVEAKMGRGDFLADRKKSFRANPCQGLGNFRYYACPEGLISPYELPEKWGLIYVKPNGQCYMVKGWGKRINAGQHRPEGAPYNETRWKVHGEVGGNVAEQYYFKVDHFLDYIVLLYMGKRYRDKKYMDNMI